MAGPDACLLSIQPSRTRIPILLRAAVCSSTKRGMSEVSAGRDDALPCFPASPCFLREWHVT